MVASITISPAAAAEKCGASISTITTGSIPWGSYTPLPTDNISGTFTQYKYTPWASGRWQFAGFRVVVETTSADGSQTQTRTSEYDTTSETETPVDSGGGVPIASPFLEWQYHWGLLDEHGEEYAYVEEDRRVVSITAKFVRTPLPFGPILCKAADGVMICNSSGSLLYN